MSVASELEPRVSLLEVTPPLLILWTLNVVQIRANCEGPSGVHVHVTEVLCEPGCDGTMRMIQQVPSEAMWDLYDTCEHDDPLYKAHLSGKGASDCKPVANDQICDVMAHVPQPMMSMRP